MPDIFVSYRRSDNPANARLLSERLKHAFPASKVFIDVEEIDLGEQWRSILRERIIASEVLVVVIGRDWLGAVNAAGESRLHQEDDIVRWEIAQFLSTDKRVIPVLVDGATLPTEGELPDELMSLPGRQAQQLSHLNYEIDVQNLIANISGERRVSKVLNRLENLLRVGKAGALLALSLGTVLFAFMWVNLFDLLELDTRSASFTMLMGDVLFEVPLSDRLHLVAIEPDHSEQLGLAPSRRADYAKLIDMAAAYEAHSIAFDLTLTTTSPQDERLAQSIRNAQASGTHVVFGFNALQQDEIQAIPQLSESGASLGLTCVGERLGQASYATLALTDRNQTYGSFPFYAAHGPAKLTPLPRDTIELMYEDAQGQSHWLDFSLLQHIERADADCPVRSPGSRVARLMVRLSHRERLRASHIRTEFSKALADWPGSGAHLRGKFILVGAEHPLDMIQTRMDALPERYGFEFHADTINALLTDDVVRPMNYYAQWFIMMLIIGFAILWRLLRIGKSRRPDLLVLLLACLTILGASVLLYAKFGYLVDGLYHLVALVVTWWVLFWLDKRWRHAGSI